MKRTPILSMLAACLLLLASCKNANKSGLFIPKDAALVFHINSSSLSSKLSWEEIKNTNWYKDAYQEASKDSFAQKLLENPEASGIDTKGDLVFFIKKRGSGGFSIFEGSVKDAAAFEALSKKISKKDKTEKDGDWNMITAGNSTVVAWNNSKFAVINDMPMGNMNPMNRGQMNESTRFGADSLKIFVKQVMTLDNDQSLFDDDRFASVMKEDGDMHLWLNSGVLYSDLTGMMSMMKIGSLFQDNVSAATINFEDGKISMKSKQYFGKEMQKMLEKFDSRKVEAAALNRIPSENVIGVMAANIDPTSLKEFLKAMGVDGLMNMVMAQQDFTIDDIFTATKGQFVFALTDLQMKDTTLTFPGEEGQAPYTYTHKQPDMNFMFATTVNQKASFDKLLGVMNKNMPTPAPFSYKLNNEWFVAGNKPQTVDAFMAGNTTKHAFTDKISGHPFGFYLDVQRLLKTKFSEDSSTNSILTESAAVWKDVVATGGEFKDGAMTSEMVINMVDSKTNSLKQLNQYIEKLNAVRKANKVAFETNDHEMQNDTMIMTVPPPPPAVDHDIPNN
jgi:hypothetical protein